MTILKPTVNEGGQGGQDGNKENQECENKTKSRRDDFHRCFLKEVREIALHKVWYTVRNELSII